MNKITKIIILILIYLILKYPISRFIWVSLTYPINLIVTFLHEFWHSSLAYLTWWKVASLQVNADWSWVAYTAWGVRSIVIAWGYIWSAFLWNLLLYISIKKPEWAQNSLYTIWALMSIIAIIFFWWIISTIIILILAGIIITSAYYSKNDDIILQFIWIASIITIIEDFRVWPSSDLSKFSDIFIFIPSYIWMYFWLIIVLAMTWYNLFKITQK